MDEDTPKLIPPQDETGQAPATERQPRTNEPGESRPPFARSYPVFGYE